MLVIAHRGSAKTAKENTLPAFREGIAKGADILEFDVRLTKDKIPIVIHNPTIGLSYGAVGMIRAMTYDDIKQALGDDAPPLLKEVLDEFLGTILLNIHLMNGGTGDVVAKMLKYNYIRQDSAWDTVLLSSFSARELKSARAVSKLVPLALLHTQNPFLFIAYHRRLALTAVGFHRLYINSFAIEIAKQAGLFVFAYTVNRPKTAVKLSDRGIDAVVTDEVSDVIHELKKAA